MAAAKPPAKKKPAPAQPAQSTTQTGGYTPVAGGIGGAVTDTSKAPALPPDLAQWVMPGGAPTVTAAAGSVTLQTLAQELGVTGRGTQLEDNVLQALAQRFNIAARQPEQGQNAQEQAGTVVPETPLTTQQGTSKAQIASELGALSGIPGVAGKSGEDPEAFLKDHKVLAALQAKLGTMPAQAGQKPSQTLTAAEAYTKFVKDLSDPKFKQSAIAYLEGGNFLSATANQGTPDTASIAGAYQKLLSTAKDSNQTVAQAYADAQKATTTPSGNQPNKPVSETVAAIQGMGEKLGVYLSPADITDISNQLAPDITASGGPTGAEDEIKDMVIQYFNPNDPRNPPGAASQMYQDVLQSASDYGIPVSSADIMNWVTEGIKTTAGDSYSIAQASTDTAAAAATHYQQLAEGLYPTLAPQIQAGQKVSTLIAPYNNITASVTGVNPQSLSDPGSAPGGVTGKYYGFLQGTKDPATGAPTMMTMDAWRKQLMQDPNSGFMQTQGAQDMAEQLSSAILNLFGKVNTMGGTSTPIQSGYNGLSDLSANTSGSGG